MKTTVRVQTNVVRSARVAQVEGIFDVPAAQKVELSWDVDMPLDAQPWNVGLVVGPSGSGKSTVARSVFADEMAAHDRLVETLRASRGSVLDVFPSTMPVKEVVAALSAVGFSSPPSWVRPFGVLSMGEQFRVSMALALAHGEKGGAPIVVDEFTSVVDRTVAQIGSAALAKAVRRGGQRFVAVTCHEDVEQWLQPEWVYRPAEQRFAWRSVQPRPRVQLTVYRVKPDLWSRFRHHHYLTHELNRSAACFAAVADFGPGMGRRLVAFDAWLPFVGRLSKGSPLAKRGHRTVCLPDYQGIGIGNALFSFLASMWKGLGYRAFSGTAHPAEIAARKRNPNWKMTRAPGMTPKGGHSIDDKRASDRLMASFEWTGAGLPRDQAQRVLNNWTTTL